MYQDYYGFTADPFRVPPKGEALFMHDSFKRAMSYLLYAIHRREGMVMVTGEAGVGKTSLVNEIITEVHDQETPISLVDCASLGEDDLLSMYLETLGVAVAAESTHSRAVRETLASLSQNKQPVLMVENAHLLSEPGFKQLQMLSNLNHDGKSLVQIMMIGQSALREKMLTPECQALHQRLIATCNIDTLQMTETREYVLHKLRAVGWTNNPSFAESVYGVVYRSSLGIPRWIDLISDRMLLNAMASDKKYISLDEICEVVSDLMKEDLLPEAVRLSTQKVA